MKEKNDPAAVDAYIETLTPEMAAPVNALRRVILDTSPEVGEHIKWNAPAFFFSGEMPAFDPKTYQRDLVVMNLRQKGHILLIFPTGSKIPGTYGRLEGDYTDVRRMVKVPLHTAGAESIAAELQEIIRAWISQASQ